MTPYIQVSTQDWDDLLVKYAGGLVSANDRDNFVRDMLTILTGPPQTVSINPIGRATRSPSKSAKDLAQVVTLDQIKLHLSIESDETYWDSHLTLMEQAAHIHTANVLRAPIDDTAGENIKIAILMLIAHWFRNREAVAEGALAAVPMGYMALLSSERTYPGVY